MGRLKGSHTKYVGLGSLIHFVREYSHTFCGTVWGLLQLLDAQSEGTLSTPLLSPRLTGTGTGYTLPVDAVDVNGWIAFAFCILSRLSPVLLTLYFLL